MLSQKKGINKLLKSDIKKSILLFAAIVFTQCFIHVFAQTKIGYVSVDEVFGAMPETKKADSALIAYQKNLANTYAAQEAELNTAFDKFINDSSKMSPAVKEAKRSYLQTRIAGMQGKQQQYMIHTKRKKKNR